MTDIFNKIYREKCSPSKKELIHSANPTKFQVLQYLIYIHEKRGDKILVFCDRPKIIQYYSELLQYPIIYGETP